MINVSKKYKEIMSRPIRNRAYVSVGIGIINQNAQGNGTATGDFAYWSRGDVFNRDQERVEYATLEENFFKADGSMLFVPENNDFMQLNYNGITTESILGVIRIDFPQSYDIKGITLNFGSAYPTEFEVETAEKTLIYTNDKSMFSATDVLGYTDFILIRPITMVGGRQRFRLQSVLMGVGLRYSNEQTKKLSHEDYVSTISEELPSENTSFSFYDKKGLFKVDDNNSFIDYLEEMQKVTISFGLEMDNGEIEWHQIATNFLDKWKIQNGEVTLTATDKLSKMEDEYSAGFQIYTRTAYEEAESILTDAGLKPDEYYIDEYLRNIELINPMPVCKHKECLQLLANACRCIIRHDENGRILIKANFATVLSIEDYAVSTNGHTKWSNPDNILIGSKVVYADLTKDFFNADGKMYFLPENEDYLKTSYVSEEVADENGLFSANPSITIDIPAAYTYFGVNIDFDGNAPEEIVIHIYRNGVLIESTKFTDLTKNASLAHEFNSFDRMVFEFTKGYPNNRVLVNKITFGSLSDYVLTNLDYMENPTGYKENRVKSVRVKVFSYEESEGKIKEIEDSVFFEKVINSVGANKILQNPLVSTLEHAELLAEWLGNYYANNVSYDVRYRGEPRVNASDIIHMETNTERDLQVEVTSNTVSFDGSFSGSMELRRALKLVEV